LRMELDEVVKRGDEARACEVWHFRKNVEIVEAMSRTYGERGFDAAPVYSAQGLRCRGVFPERIGFCSRG
jgi:hypothetical protein